MNEEIRLCFLISSLCGVVYEMTSKDDLHSDLLARNISLINKCQDVIIPIIRKHREETHRRLVIEKHPMAYR